MFGRKEAPKGTFCPLMQRACCREACAFWTCVRGEHPQTGREVDEWGCAIAWLPILLVENARRSVGVAAATEDMRNKVHRLNETLEGPLTAMAEVVVSAARHRPELGAG